MTNNNDVVKNQEAFKKAQQEIRDRIVEEIETIVAQSLDDSEEDPQDNTNPL